MKYTTSLLALSFATLSLADDLRARSVPGNNVIPIQFVKERTPWANDVQVGRWRLEEKSLKRRGLDKRASETILESLDNAQQLYYANITMGTPAQNIRLQIDTGSSDVWANSANSAYCKNSQNLCNEGSFDETKSSTYKVVGANEFNISYVDGTGASGDYFTDNFGIGGITVTGQTMGLASDTTIPAGIMGVGYDTNEAILQFTNTPYSSIIDTMVSQKLINSKAYSLWLNDLDANTGSVLFGGIDTKKYQGSLSGLPLQVTENTNTITDFAVVLSAVSYTTAAGKVVSVPMSSGNLPVILDSGSTLMYLPSDMIDTIATAFNAEYSSDAQAYILNCNVGTTSAFINVQFGGSKGPTIKVALSELVLPATTSTGQQATDSNGNAVCTFGLQPSTSSDLLFGDTFLRSAYVVYDLDLNMLYIAQTVFNQGESNVLEITSASGVPDVSGVASGATASVTGTGVVAGSGRPTGTGGTAATSKAAAPNMVHPVEFGYLFPMLTVMLCGMVGGVAVFL